MAVITEASATNYQITATYLVVHSGVLQNLYGVDNRLLTGSVFYQHQEKILTKTVGNYQFPYEVISISGRLENDLYRRDYPTSQSINIIPILTGTPYLIAPRLKNRSVFVVRFSAPGDANTQVNKLDIESLEYSPYNSFDFRNLKSKKSLNDEYKTVMNLDATATYTIHKINPNTRYRAGETSIQTKSDNGFISHQLPHHVDQMYWITSSIKRATNPWLTQSLPSLYIEFNEQTGTEYYYTNTLYAQDSAAANSAYVHPKRGSDLTYSWATDTYSIYGFNSWTQIRANQNWKTRLLKRNSYIAIDKDIDSDLIFALTSSI